MSVKVRVSALDVIGAGAELAHPPEGGRGRNTRSASQPMTETRKTPILFGGLILRRLINVRRLINWFTRSGLEPDSQAPAEAIVLRTLGLGYLVLFIVATVGTRPHPGFEGRGAVITVAMVALVACALAGMPHHAPMPPRRRIALLLGVSAASAVLASRQPHGIWQAGPYFIAIVAGGALERVPALLTVVGSLTAVIVTAAAAGHGAAATSILLGVPPWFFVMRLIRAFRVQNERLKASQAAQARAATEAERGRISREMHDVLAHSLSALALQLESARLLARDRETDPDVTRALDQAHHLAAAGLDEARRAIAAARGEQLPGPERLEQLAAAFEEQSGIPASVSVEGEATKLAPDARLAVYRTAQEALTNVRRHATPARVEIKLSYSTDAAVLSVEDHAAPGTSPPPGLPAAGGGFGLSGMRERTELLGGTLKAEPTHTGFLVELRLPAEPHDEATAPTPSATAPGR
jgi:signal transduction histidine kinase